MCLTPSPTNPHCPGSQVGPASLKSYSLMISLFLKDGLSREENTSLQRDWGWTHSGTRRDREDGKGEGAQASRVRSLPARQASASFVFPFQSLTVNACTWVMGSPDPTCLPSSAPHLSSGSLPALQSHR